ncbi:MAG: chemotaxis protein CheV [Lachnospirales bacterium]
MENSSKHEIILDTDSNEFSVMEFKVDGKCYGINVGKVNIIMKYENVIPMPNANECIEGIFKPRDEIITVVNLPKFLKHTEFEDTSKDILIIVNINKCTLAFHVHSVEGIRRVSWKDINKPDKTIYGTVDSLVTGIAKYQDRLITVLDFERIMFDINPEAYAPDDFEIVEGKVDPSKPVLVVEDSATPLTVIVNKLKSVGYTEIITKTNGNEAWEYLERLDQKGYDISEQVKCIISDIEMPIMDGLEFTKKVRADNRFKHLPIILFSALVNEEMKEKCLKSGATGQISKPEINNLVTLVNNCILP